VTYWIPLATRQLEIYSVDLKRIYFRIYSQFLHTTEKKTESVPTPHRKRWKEDRKRSHRKRWKRQVRNGGKLTMAEEAKAFLSIFKALSDEDNRQFLLENYEKERLFRPLLYKCIKSFGLSHGRGREAMKMSLKELTKNPGLADKVSEENIENLCLMYGLLRLDPKFGQKCEDSSDSEASYGLHRGTPLRTITNSGRHSEGTDSTHGSGSSTLSEV
jgi:hypothetical protein